MGLEISRNSFIENDYSVFYKQLRSETAFLQHLLNAGKMQNTDHSIGLELEASLVNSKAQPANINTQIISKANHPQLVEELALSNIEMNGRPFQMNGLVLNQLKEDIFKVWSLCQSQMKGTNCSPLLIGTVPCASLESYSDKNMSPKNRYNVLNSSLFSENLGHQIHISGESDKFKTTIHHIMPASSVTSLQFQWKIPAQQFQNIYNAALIATPFSVALSANSPFLFGQELWDETRIPFFEHAINSSRSDKSKATVSRAGFGTSYLKHGALELYLNNLVEYPVIIPELLTNNQDPFAHLNLHNGTIWRWNRPVVGHQEDGTHLRLEHRVMSSGPTIIDGIANIAFFLGLTYELSKSVNSSIGRLPFNLLKRNFYTSSRNSLNSEIYWFDGTRRKLAELLDSEIIDLASTGLRKLGIEKEQIHYYLEKIIRQRVKKLQNGALWQKSFARKYKKDLVSMTNSYKEQQFLERPVHLWKLTS